MMIDPHGHEDLTDYVPPVTHSCEDAKIGVEIWGVYDGVLFWRCGVCDRAWHRFPEGHHLRARAAHFVEGRPDAR